MTEIIVLIILIFILLSFNSIISASETAITSVSVVKLRSYIKIKKKSKKISDRTVFLINNYNRTLMSILILNTLINTAIATIFTILLTLIFTKLNKGLLAVISTLSSTILLLILGEIIPKIIAKKYSEYYFVLISGFLKFLCYLFYPLLWWTKILEDDKNRDHINEQELLELVNIISDNGALESTEKELIKSAIKFDDKKLKNIVVSKKNIKFLYHDAKREDIINFYHKYNYSRIIIVHHISKKVSGIIHAKDLLKTFINKKEISINNLIRQPLFMHLNTDLDDALKIMQEQQIHIAIVISNDNENKFIGIVTMEDLIEQIIGKIYDEYDKPGKIKEIGHLKWKLSSDANMYLFLTKYLKLEIKNIEKNITILEWFIKKHKKNIKKITDLDDKKIQFKNYLFMSHIINDDKKNIFFEVKVHKIKEKNK